MNTAIVWTLLIVNFGADFTTVFGRFDTEAQCEAAAQQMLHRSIAKHANKGYWVPKLQGVCVPGDLSKDRS